MADLILEMGILPFRNHTTADSTGVTPKLHFSADVTYLDDEHEPPNFNKLNLKQL